MSNFISNAFQVPNAVIDDLMANLSPNALKCYLLIVRKTTGWGKASDRISESQFMDKTGIKNVKTVRTAMVELSDLGLINQNKKRGQITEYSLVLNSENQYQKTVVPKNGTSTKNYPKPVPKIGSKVVPKIGTLQKTITKTTNTKESARKKYKLIQKSRLENSELPEQLNTVAWTQWLDYRTKVKKPFKTPRGELRAMNELIKISQGDQTLQHRIVDQSIDHEWVGLFELKAHRGNGNSNTPLANQVGAADADYSRPEGF